MQEQNIIKPMLAVEYSKVKNLDLSHGYYASPKYDGCFSGDALVTTNIGLVPIGKIVENKMKIKVLSFNEKSGQLEFKNVINYFNNGSKKGMSFKGSKVTNNHKFYTCNGWEEYENIDHVSVLDNSYAMSILTGMLLGDSSPSVEKRYDSYATRLTWCVSEIDEEFGEAKASLFEKIAPVSRSNRLSGFGSKCLSYTTVPLSQRGFEFWHLHKMDYQYLNSFGKRKTDLELKDLKYFTDLSLALWYFDDGTIQYNNGDKDTPRISLSIPRYSEKSWNTFKQLFKMKYAVEPNITRYGKDVRMSFTSAESVYLLYRIARVASGMMPRKLPEDLRFGVIPEQISSIGLKCEYFSRKRTHPDVNFTAYDIEVENNHNYFCNGTLVHNCRAIILDGVAYSRSMKPFRNKVIQEWAQKHMDELNGCDGELISGSPTAPNVFRDSTSVVMSEDGGDDFTFYVFDNVLINAEFKERWESISANIEAGGLSKVVAVEHVLIHSEEELLALEQKYLDEGYEGIMLNFSKGFYKQGRSGIKNPELIKKKIFTDSEFEVIGVDCLYSNQNEATLNELGYTERSTSKDGLVPQAKLGSLELVTPAGVRFRCGSGFDDNMRISLWKEKDNLVGKYVKVKYFEQGNYDAPRFPIFVGFRDKEDM